MLLIGWSTDGGEFLLAYGYMSNGSLNNHLLRNGMQLPWKTRFNIVFDLSSTLFICMKNQRNVLCIAISSQLM
jgi:hypothetical protein